MKKEETFYDVLKLSPSASHSELVAAYHEALNAFSHDSLATYSLLSPEQTQEQLSKIEEAYAILSNMDRKRQYDQKINNPSVVSLNFAKVTPANPQPTPPVSLSPMKTFTPPATENRPAPIATVHPASVSTTAGPDPLAELAAPSAPAVAPGALLIEGRTRAGMTLEEVNRVTKISIRYLKAMENQNLEQIPARVYLQGFLKNLAHIYKLDGQALTIAYLQILDEKSAAAPRLKPI